MDIKTLLLDLEIIKQIQENDKLAVCVVPGNTRLFVHSSNILSGITRWYNGYNRESCIEYLETLVNNIKNATTTIIGGHHTEIADTLKHALKDSISGYINLKTTYKNDSIIVAKLTLIVNSLNDLINVLDSFINSSYETITELNICENGLE